MTKRPRKRRQGSRDEKRRREPTAEPERPSVWEDFPSLLRLVVGIVLMGGALLLTHSGLDVYWMGRASRSWPSTQGTATAVRVTTNVSSTNTSSGTSHRTTHPVVVTFRYEVEGQAHEGEVVVSRPSDESEAKQIAAQQPMGEIVCDVFYDPAQPHRYLTTRGEIWHGLLMLFGALYLFALGLGLAWKQLRGGSGVLPGFIGAGVLLVAQVLAAFLG